METTVIRARGVSFAYGSRKILSDISLDVRPGERLAVVGSNGGGKSTLIRLLAGISRPGEGIIQIPARRTVSYVPQQVMPSMLPWFSARQNLLLPLALARRSVTDQETAFKEITAGVTPDFPWDARLSTLSGGQVQVVAVLQGFITRPELLLLDEPTSALDLANTFLIQETIVRQSKRLNTAVVFVTHDLDEAVSIADRVLILDSGRLATPCKDGSAADLRTALLQRAFG